MANSVTQILNQVADYAKGFLRVGLKAKKSDGTFEDLKSDDAGALKVSATVTGSLVSVNDHLKVRDSFTAKEAHRVILTPNSESTQIFPAQFETLHVLNYGPGDVYLDIDSAAAVGGADDVLIQESVSITIPLAGTDVHLIGSSASVVQLVAYSTPASGGA